VTYEKAQLLYKKRHGRTVKTCWIADVKRRHGKTGHVAPNRIGPEPKYPCPDSILQKLEKILREQNTI